MLQILFFPVLIPVDRRSPLLGGSAGPRGSGLVLAFGRAAVNPAFWQRLQSRYGSDQGSHVLFSPRRADRLEAKAMTYYDAALQVLRSARQPLTTRQITELAIAEELITPAGQTPERSMAGVLCLRVRNDPEL